MNIAIECPACKQQYQVDAAIIGNEVECAVCHQIFVANETTPIKRRLSILIDQQEWSKAREYCEKLLDIEPENPELYLMLCLIEHKLTNEKLLINTNTDLLDDKNYSTALKFSIGERKQQLIDIQSQQQQRLLRQYEFFMQKCMEYNNVSDISMLSKCIGSLADDVLFQAALKCAPSDCKKKLICIQEEQSNNSPIEQKIWRRTKEIRRGGWLGLIIGIVFCLTHCLFASFNRGKALNDDTIQGFIFVYAIGGMSLGFVMEFLWNECFTLNNKKFQIAWSIIAGTLINSIILVPFFYVAARIERRRIFPISFARFVKELFLYDDFFYVLIIGFLFDLIWIIVWHHFVDIRTKRASRLIQNVELEYYLHEKNESDFCSKEDQMKLNLLLEKKNNEIVIEKRIKRTIMTRVKMIFVVIAFIAFGVIGVSLYQWVTSYPETEFQKAKIAYRANRYDEAAIHFRNAKRFGKPLDPPIQVFLGLCYYAGIGVSKDYSKAFSLFEDNSNVEAVNAPRAWAQFYLGKCYYNGYGCQKSSWFDSFPVGNESTRLN